MSAMTQEVVVLPGSAPLVVDGSGVTQPVSGTITVANPGLTDTQLRASAVPVSGPLTDVQLRATPVPVSATLSFPASSSSTVTQVTSNSANQTLLAANANRKKVILHFLTGVWNVKFGAGASASSRTLQVSSSGFYLEETVWKGIIDAACTTNGKVVDITELV